MWWILQYMLMMLGKIRTFKDFFPNASKEVEEQFLQSMWEFLDEFAVSPDEMPDDTDYTKFGGAAFASTEAPVEELPVEFESEESPQTGQL